MGKTTTHDYTRRSWGWDYVFTPIDGGHKGSMSGWSRGATIKAGDLLLLQNGTGETRYRVDSISYHRDPSDMWAAKVSFAPRTEVY